MFLWGMMIRPDNRELEQVISIALKTAPTYALRNVMTPRGKIDQKVAVETLTARVVAALSRYELTREPDTFEMGAGSLPLFPDDAPARGENRG
jgi:hypothetical protein